MVRAAHKHRVKRVVITSSIASILNQAEADRKDIYNEDDWSNVAVCNAYAKSKTLAEKAAWVYLEGIPESERFELVIINPGFVLGPNLCNGDFTSGSIIMKFLLGKFPGIPRI